MTAVLDFIDAAAVALAGHATYTLNKAGTRIRCNGEECGTVLEAPGGEEDAVLVFARHQAKQLPEPVAAQAPAVVLPAPEAEPAEPEPAADDVAAEESTTEPDPEPSGEPMEPAVEEKPAPKSRRDTKALGATIAGIKKGDRVTAFFKHPRYGEFAVEGTVIQGGAGQERNQLIVGGWYLNIGERAAKFLQDLVIVATAGNHEFEIPKPSEANDHVGIGS